MWTEKYIKREEREKPETDTLWFVKKLQVSNKIYVTSPQNDIKALVFFLDPKAFMSIEARDVQIKLEMKEQHHIT